MSKRSIYVAGPMTGIKEFNFPAFFASQKMLESQGWLVRVQPRSQGRRTT
jgi:hypothetical protein